MNTQTFPQSSARQFTQQELTIFAIPKAFEGESDIIQRNAIRSWKELGAFADIVLLGNDAGVAAAAKELDVTHLPDVATNELGTPILSSAFQLVREHSTSRHLAYCNCDIILLHDFVAAVSRLIEANEVDRFMATGQRTNIEVDHLVDFTDPTQIETLVDQAHAAGQLESIMCKDFFVFPRSLYENLPEFVVGRGNWDNWMVKEAKRQNVPVINVTGSVLALHQNHGHGHVGNRWDCYVNGTEARENQKLGKGRHWITGSSFDFRLGTDGLIPSRNKYIAGDFWWDFPKAIRLIGKLLKGS